MLVQSRSLPWQRQACFSVFGQIFIHRTSDLVKDAEWALQITAPESGAGALGIL
jgi:hypothetical protein